MLKLRLFRSMAPQVEVAAPPRILSGHPTTRTWNHTSDRDDHLFTGIWEATPGAWAVSYDEWEYCYIVSGRAIIRDPLGNEVEVSAGDSFVIEPGFEGSWTILETVTKQYVILMLLG
jgi:uncharacterized protein